MDWDSRRLRRTSNGDRDVERQVVRAGSGDIHATLNATERGREEADQLNLTVEGDNACEADRRRLDRLAHVTKNDGARVGGLGNEGVQRTRAGGRHVSRRVVAHNVAGRRGEVERNSGGACDDGGGAEVHAIVIDLANKTLNGGHLIFRT